MTPPKLKIGDITLIETSYGFQQVKVITAMYFKSDWGWGWKYVLERVIGETAGLPTSLNVEKWEKELICFE